MATNPGPAEPEVHPLLRRRWSPRVWDPEHQVSPAEVESLLEAARWAPSAGNSQPWAFVVGLRGDANHERMCRHLAGSSARWAPSASLLVMNLCHLQVAGTDWEYSEFAAYDLGQAVAHLTVQAQALGLAVRQFAAFDRAALAAEFEVSDHWQVTTMSAVGRIPDGVEPHALVRPGGVLLPRERRPRSELLWNRARGEE